MPSTGVRSPVTVTGKPACAGNGFMAIEVPATQVFVSDAVSTYLFNSQLLSRDDGSMVLVLPQECREPVSYTHLDVYKRQINDSSVPKSGPKTIPPAITSMLPGNRKREQRARRPLLFLSPKMKLTMCFSLGAIPRLPG